MKVYKLEKEFVGIGEVKGFRFRQIKESEDGYIYEVSANGSIHFEIIKRLKSPLCIDFEKRIYSTTEFKEYYPGSATFGTSGFWTDTLEKAEKRLESFKVLSDGI